MKQCTLNIVLFATKLKHPPMGIMSQTAKSIAHQIHHVYCISGEMYSVMKSLIFILFVCCIREYGV